MFSGRYQDKCNEWDIPSFQGKEVVVEEKGQGKKGKKQEKQFKKGRIGEKGRKRKFQQQMEAFEWEEKKECTPLWVHMIAGSLAGMSEHLSMLPLDNVKTHCQAGSHLNFWQIIRTIYKSGGISNFYSGSSVLALGCVPAHAIYFSIYEKSKIAFGCEGEQNHYKFALVGVASSLFHDLVMTPTEVLKQRLQLIRSQGSWPHTMQLARAMYKNEGIISFYRSFAVNFFMNMPFSSMIIFMNEKLKYMFKVKSGDTHLMYYLCGGLAGALAAIPTTPFDVIKTKLNTQSCLNNQCEKKNVCDILSNSKINYNANSMGPNGRGEPALKMNYSKGKEIKIKYHNIADTTATIFREEGLMGFMSGLKVRMAISSLSSAVAWGTYNVVTAMIDPSLAHKAH